LLYNNTRMNSSCNYNK